ncbi:Trk system potassium transporter TrkA [Streptococcus caprae]|uniref:Trk system potassium uptake protein TrkA n=1 Tax=Streptococcus caprae TaxID=1640501 RepID=A0ABV8CXI0_9STRE
MKIIVVGGGKVGTALCRSLVGENHDVVLIEQNSTVLEKVTKRYDIMGIVGNGANYKILEQADIADCDIFVALTNQDEVNMVAAVLAKKMGAKETVVRVRNPEYSNAYFKNKNFLDFSMLVNPEKLAARYIANTVEFPNARSVEHFANGRVMLMEFKIKPDSKLCKMSLVQFRQKFGNVLVCAIERNNEVIIPKGDDVIKTGDIIFVTGSRVEVNLLHNFIRPQVVKSLMVIGAGKIAYYLMAILQNTRLKVKLIEIDAKRAEFFTEAFPNLHVVLGDGTAKDLLMEESALSYDAVATLTGVDEENIVASMYLEKMGINKNITKVNRTSLLEIIDSQEFSTIVTPKAIAVDSIMHFIRGRENAQELSLEAMHHVANGQIETLQFDILDTSKMIGQQLSTIKLKKNIIIAAIIRKGKTLVPSGYDTFQLGDKIIVISLQPNIRHINDLLAR